MIDLVFFNEKLFELKKIAEIEGKLGNGTTILAKNFSSEKELSELKEKIKKIEYDFRLCHLMLSPEPRELNKFRGKTEFIAVLGGNVTLNKFAVSTKGIDFLLQPCNEGPLTFDTAIAQTAVDNRIPIAFCFSQFLESEGAKRSSLFRNYFFTAKLLQKFKLNCLVFSGAKYCEQTRSIKNLSCFLVLLGFTKEQAERFTERFAGEFFGRKSGEKK